MDHDLLTQYIDDLRSQIDSERREKEFYKELYFTSIDKVNEEELVTVDPKTLQPIPGRIPWREKRHEIEVSIAEKLRRSPAEK